MKRLVIARDFSLPLDTVTQSIAILAKRRAGKSYTARRIVEQLAKAQLQTVIVDPKGDWWGIRSSADGKSPGLPVTILGGAHGDLPLEVGAGELVAKLVVFECVSVLLDLSNFRKKEVAHFMSDFLESLYRLKAMEQYRSPVMLVVDEADAIAPQKPYSGEERMLGAIEDIVRRGGQRGIGSLCITQRSAVLNKNVLTQTQVLVTMRTIAPQDLAAMKAWIDAHGTEDESRVMMTSLPSLKTGHAWFWSPGWPDENGIFKLVEVLPIATFDSGATPKPGQRRIEPKHLVEVDLEALRRQMAETIEKAKADDPRELRRQIAELQKQLATQAKSERPEVTVRTREFAEKLKTSSFQQGAAAERRQIAHTMKPLLRECDKRLSKLLPISVKIVAADGGYEAELGREVASAISAAIEMLDKTAPLPAMEFQPLGEPKAAAATVGGSVREAAISQPPRQPRQAPPNGAVTGEIKLDKLRRAILTALAQHPKGLRRAQILLHANYRPSGDVSTAFADLTRNDLIVSSGTANSSFYITRPGLEALGPFDPLPVGSDLLRQLLSGTKLAKVERAILEEVARAYPDALPRAEILSRANYKPSGDVSTAFSRLRRYDYIVHTPSGFKLAEELV